jgi:phenylacetate-CoA ligase
MKGHPDHAEFLEPDALHGVQREKLARVLEGALSRSGFYRGKYAGVRFDPLRDPLHVLPLTTRQEIERDQEQHPPFGTLLTRPLAEFTRLHQTSGSSGRPLVWLDTPDSWQWWQRCWRTIFGAAGVTAADRVFFPFSFGPFIGFWTAFETAASCGNLVLSGGGMSTAARLEFMVQHQATVVCCTPTYALRLAEVAAAEGCDLRSTPVRALIVAGEPGGSLPATRSRIEEAFGARVFDHAGMTEIGAWGFECLDNPGGLHVMESEFIAEVLDPLTGLPAEDGRDGELVLTNLGRSGMPLIRYRSGDQASLTRGPCPCGRHLARIPGGLRGRRDDMMIIRGNNVFPSAVENILRGFAEVAEFRMSVEHHGPLAELMIEIEPLPGAGDSVCHRVTQAVVDRLHLRPLVRLAAPGALPRYEMKARRRV